MADSLDDFGFTEEELKIPTVKYEYLDHPSDVQIHSWGDNIEETFEQCAVGMFGYMTDLEKVDIVDVIDIEVSASDLINLMFRFLDELLYKFSAEPNFISKKIKIFEFDKENFKIRARGYGEPFTLEKHTQGTEVKAITYSNMQVYDEEGHQEAFVIVDI
ncbi:protein archease-like [Artemia franciscana]|uniref:protein archease-like n=1 Tax=Artemia franciscana TaxID=6661 RepID=UPI0032DB459B